MMDTGYNIIEETNLNVPYTHNNLKVGTSMRFLCRYIKKQDVKLEYIYNYNIDEKNIYRGLSERLYVKNSPTSYEEFEPESISTINSSNYIRLYFPTESLSIYIKGTTKYYVGIYLYIKDIKHYLFSNIIDSYNNLACPQFVDGGVRYQEYQDIPLIDINEYIKRYKDNDSQPEYLIFINVQPVVLYNKNFITTQNTSCGSSFINYNAHNDLFIKLSIDSINRNIKSEFTYDKNFGSTVKEYINNIYGDNVKISILYYLIDTNDENIYTWDEVDVTNQLTSDVYNKSYDDLHKAEDEQSLWTWDQYTWSSGMQIRASLKISNQEDEFGVGRMITIHSHPIFITKNNLNKFLSNNNIKIEIPEDMVKNIRVENKIETKNIIVSQNSSESGAIKPVFFKAYDLSSITVHRDMVQNIAIDLDEYKSKVDTFYLKICGNYFIEYSRTIDGVIFCIDGSIITSNTGTYYICNSDKSYITSGKYTCD